MLNFFKGIKEQLEPLAWFVGLIVAVVSGLVTTWKLYINPAIENYVQDATTKIVAELAQVKEKLTEEFDSTYYFTKTFTFGNPSLNQEPLAQFFYAKPADRVSLFIWSEGEPTKEVIKINGGPDLSLTDVEASSWTDVEITKYLKKRGPLTIETYQGITKDIYEIVVTPIPLKDFSRKKDIKNGYEEGHSSNSRTTIAPREVQNVEREVRVYCLLVVRRSKFKSESK